jgi:hypothetical protein
MEASTDVDRSKYSDIPTTLSDAIVIDELLGNSNWKDAYNRSLASLLSKGETLPLNSTPQFKLKHNRTHNVHFIVAPEGPVVPVKSTFTYDQAILNCASPDLQTLIMMIIVIFNDLML